MQHILSYPRYFPNPVDFRAYLLLYDQVSTIVPWNDQPRVLSRPEIAELIEELPGEPFNLRAPQWLGHHDFCFSVRCGW